MDCKQIQKIIPDYVVNQLSLRDEEIFVTHVTECPECREELEIYYIVEYGLSDDDNINPDFNSDEVKKLIQIYDFKNLVDYKLNNSRNEITKIKKSKHLAKTAFVMIETCLLSACILYIIHILK